MDSISKKPGGPAHGRRQLTTAVKDSLREMSSQLALLNHQVGTQLGLRDGDLGCLDLIVRDGPFSPSGLARRAGLHPATITGVLDRLERGGWVERDRDPADRRGVMIRARRGRIGEVLRLYAGMNRSLDEICAGYGEAELELLAGFLRQTTAAGETAAGDLAAG
jgi:DNA-binding MarR family transcriptional regulator